MGYGFIDLCCHVLNLNPNSAYIFSVREHIFTLEILMTAGVIQQMPNTFQSRFHFLELFILNIIEGMVE